MSANDGSHRPKQKCKQKNSDRECNNGNYKFTARMPRHSVIYKKCKWNNYPIAVGIFLFLEDQQILSINFLKNIRPDFLPFFGSTIEIFKIGDLNCGIFTGNNLAFQK